MPNLKRDEQAGKRREEEEGVGAMEEKHLRTRSLLRMY